MKNPRKHSPVWLPCLLVLLSPVALLAGPRPISEEMNIASQLIADPTTDEGIVRTTVYSEDYRILHTQNKHEIQIDAFGTLKVSGKPKLPAKIISIAIPPDAKLVDVEYTTKDGVIIEGEYQITPNPMPRVIGRENPIAVAKEEQRYASNHEAVYGSDTPYPAKAAEFVRTAGYRKYNLVDVRVCPVRYNPLSKRLTWYPEITVDVKYCRTGDASKIVSDNLAKTEQVARSFIANHDMAQGWYAKDTTQERGLHDFVIISESPVAMAAQSLITWETMKGRTVQTVTTSWINDNYSGYDLAERIRNFLRDKYPSLEWGIQDVLIIGDYDSVPMRRVDQNTGYGEPETDFYYAELSLPDSESWDADGDHQYAESSDPVDFYAEINVGRIPWSDAATITSICEKTVAYEQSIDPSYKKSILLLGAFFWDDTDNAALMEATVTPFYMSDWDITRLYEQNSTVYSTYACDAALTHTNVMATWPEGTYAFVNWAGHGSPTSTHIMGDWSAAFITSGDCPDLNDDYPAIIFADACSNSDTDELNIGQSMLKQGAVGFLGSTKVAYGCAAWNSPTDGSSQSMDYFFSTKVTSGNFSQGEAQQEALREMYSNGYWDYPIYETCEWGAIWGNPNLSMGTPPPLSVTLITAVPSHVPDETVLTLQARITDGLEAYLPDSATLHYRLDGGAFLTTPLVLVEDDVYEASLPELTCGDTPSFYLSAEGDGGTTIYSPMNAPTTTYAVSVGSEVTLLDDDFETDQGWTVYAGADSGNWERADPEYMSSAGIPTQPNDDHSPTGSLCYVTGAAAGTSPGSNDLDGGPSQLISPRLNLAGKDAFVSYYRWFHVNTQYDDELVVQVSNNNGLSWVTVEAIGSRQEWTYAVWRVADYVTPTNQVLVRFSVDDSPNNSIVEALVDDFKVEASVCGITCLSPPTGDMNDDGLCDGTDIQMFIEAIMGEPSQDLACAGDFDGNASLGMEDIPGMVEFMLGS